MSSRRVLEPDVIIPPPRKEGYTYEELYEVLRSFQNAFESVDEELKRFNDRLDRIEERLEEKRKHGS